MVTVPLFPDAFALRTLTKISKILSAVPIPEEDILSVIASLRDMMRHTGQHDSRLTDHARRISEKRKNGKN